jgi:hypothetical protein
LGSVPALGVPDRRAECGEHLLTVQHFTEDNRSLATVGRNSNSFVPACSSKAEK